MNRRFIRQVGALRWAWRYAGWQMHKRIWRTDQLLAPCEPTGLRFAGLDEVAFTPWRPDQMKMAFALPAARAAECLAAAEKLRARLVQQR